jgi:hypothetical protein
MTKTYLHMEDDERSLLGLMLSEATHYTGSGKDDDDAELGELIRKKDPREIIAEHPEFPSARVDDLLEKWAENDIYDYGVTNDLGWFYLADARDYLEHGVAPSCSVT